jgi:putative phage-type endonuclease
MRTDGVPEGVGGVLVLPASAYRRDRPRWLRARRYGLGASDTAAVLGLSEYRTALDVWLDKTAEADPDDSDVSDAARYGHLLEGPVARDTVRRYPELGKLVPTPGLLAHPDFPWMLATVDYCLAPRGRRGAPVSALLEVKTTSDEAYRRKWIGGVPPASVQVQCQQQLAVTGLDTAWVTCWKRGSASLAEPYPVARDPRVIGQIIGYAGAWWARHMIGGVRPEPVFEDAGKLAELFPADPAADALQATPELEDTFAALLDARARMRAAEDDMAAAKFRIQAALGERTALASAAGEVLVTWNAVTSRRWDTKALAADHPELAEHYRPAKTSRSFLVKAED